MSKENDFGIDLGCNTPLLQFDGSDVEAILDKHGKTLKSLEKDVKVVRKWAQHQEHIPLVPCDRKLAVLLVLNDCCLEKTKKALDKSYVLKSLMPEFFKMLPKDKEMIRFAKAYNMFPLPRLTKNRKRIFVSQPVNPELFDADAYVTQLLQVSELCTIHDFNDGMEYIIDFKSFAKEVFPGLTQAKLKKMYLFLGEVYSKKILPIHGVNLSEEAMEFMRTCQENLLEPGEPMYCHAGQGYEALYEFYSKDILPKDFGGNLKSLAEYREEWIKFLQENNDYFGEIQKAKIKETPEMKGTMAKEFVEFKKIIGE